MHIRTFLRAFWLGIALISTSLSAQARCQSDQDCSTGQLCQCARHFNPGSASCDEMGGQCAAPVTQKQLEFRVKATQRAEEMRTKLGLPEAVKQAEPNGPRLY